MSETIEGKNGADEARHQAVQSEMPFALIHGEPLTELPTDLYIPPDALEVILEAFEGPLDLLLYLIRRQNLDILDIPIFAITRQYMEYIALMQELRLELAAEYLVMAAMLAEIKSRMLLPRPVSDDDDEEDPRAELVRRLQEYEQFRQAAEDLDGLPRVDRDVFPARAEAPPMERRAPDPEVDLRELLLVFAEVVRRAEMFSHHNVQREPLSVRQRMSEVLAALGSGEFVDFRALFRVEDGRAGVIVTLLASLELLKEHLVEVVQAEPFAPIYLQAVARADAAHTEFEADEYGGWTEIELGQQSTETDSRGGPAGRRPAAHSRRAGIPVRGR